MARQKDQVLLFSDGELSLLKNTFANNEERLYLIRNVLLQFPLTAMEKKQIKAFMTPEVYAVVKKRIYPDIDPNAPFFQMSDMYISLSTEIEKRTIEDIEPHFLAHQLVIDYLGQQFQVLKDMSKKVDLVIKLADLATLKDKTVQECFVDIKARNYLLTHVDSFLNHIKTLGGKKEESVEDIKARLTRDSSK